MAGDIFILRDVFIFLLGLLLCGDVSGDVFRIGYISGSDRLKDDLTYSRPGYLINGAIALAIDQINAHHPDNLLINHTLEFVHAETYGKEDLSIKHTAVFCQNLSISVVIGPQETCFHEARLASSFNKLMLTYYCDRPFKSESDKGQYSTFVTVKPPASQISRSVASLLLHYNWRKVTVVYNNASETSQRTADSIQHQLKSHGIEILQSVAWSAELSFFAGLEMYKDLYPEVVIENPFVKVVDSTKNKTRIYLTIGDEDGHLGFMNAMESAGLIDSGEYFVVGVYTEPYKRNTPSTYLCGKFGDSIKETTEKAFRSFLGVVPRGFTVNFTEFNAAVNSWNLKPPFNFKWDDDWPDKQVRPEAAYLHDGVFLYARALNECLARSDCDPHDGKRLMQFLLDKPYSSAMGYLGYIDANGDAEGNYSLLAIKENPSGYAGCSDLPLDHATNFKAGLVDIGTFLLSTNGSADLPTLVLKDGENIPWPNGITPKDEPECGFDGSKCFKVYKDNRLLTIILAIVGLIIFLSAALFIFLRYRQWKYERELDSLIWKINWVDLQVDELREYLATTSNTDFDHQSQLCVVCPNFDIGTDFRFANVNIELGYYKKQLVAIKRLKKKHVSITREVKIELKMMRDLRHDNLCQFIGACTEPVAIVMEYVKNNFKDLLYDENSPLDSIFITSLISDLVKGMCYIHQSPLKSHGRLKPSNLLVDSRFVLKITDYGLHEFKRRSPSTEFPASQRKSEEMHFENFLWTSPELLRMPCAPAAGTSSGDVYSFAIVLFEVYGRAGPFGRTDMDARTIIDELRFPNQSSSSPLPLRPPIETLQGVPDYVLQLITDCWTENPFARPDFQDIKARLKPMTKGMKSNIMENVLVLLQRYANNLEALVGERTTQLQEEKKKTETLLYEILPRPVAEHLIREEQVEAEQFDCVTIFFSDIVGFTALSAESTPFEVVAFLNNLYTLFDTLLAQYDAYKVETIGDSYMVCSGLPIRNGNAHAGVIASMALHLLEAIKTFEIAHRPDKKLLLRIGVHSGPVVAGVVGRKMPRYCLFGDTVNTASRFESTGEPQKIHCSAQCKAILDELGGYHVVPRGIVHMKGKGDQLTYWIVDEEESRKQLRRFQEYTSLADLNQRDSPILAKWGSQNNPAPRPCAGRRFSTLRKMTLTSASTSPQPSKNNSVLRLDNVSVHAEDEFPWTESVSGGMLDKEEHQQQNASTKPDALQHANGDLAVDSPLLKGYFVESQSGNVSPTLDRQILLTQDTRTLIL